MEFFKIDKKNIFSPSKIFIPFVFFALFLIPKITYSAAPNYIQDSLGDYVDPTKYAGTNTISVQGKSTLQADSYAYETYFKNPTDNSVYDIVTTNNGDTVTQIYGNGAKINPQQR